MSDICKKKEILKNVERTQNSITFWLSAGALGLAFGKGGVRIKPFLHRTLKLEIKDFPGDACLNGSDKIDEGKKCIIHSNSNNLIKAEEMFENVFENLVPSRVETLTTFAEQMEIQNDDGFLSSECQIHLIDTLLPRNLAEEPTYLKHFLWHNKCMIKKLGSVHLNVKDRQLDISGSSKQIFNNLLEHAGHLRYVKRKKMQISATLASRVLDYIKKENAEYLKKAIWLRLGFNEKTSELFIVSFDPKEHNDAKVVECMEKVKVERLEIPKNLVKILIGRKGRRLNFMLKSLGIKNDVVSILSDSVSAEIIIAGRNASESLNTIKAVISDIFVGNFPLKFLSFLQSHLAEIFNTPIRFDWRQNFQFLNKVATQTDLDLQYQNRWDESFLKVTWYDSVENKMRFTTRSVGDSSFNDAADYYEKIFPMIPEGLSISALKTKPMLCFLNTGTAALGRLIGKDGTIIDQLETNNDAILSLNHGYISDEKHFYLACPTFSVAMLPYFDFQKWLEKLTLSINDCISDNGTRELTNEERFRIDLSHVKNLRLTQNVRHILGKYGVRAKVFKHKEKHRKNSSECSFILFGRDKTHFVNCVKPAAEEIELFMEKKLLKKKNKFLEKFGNKCSVDGKVGLKPGKNSVQVKNSNMRKPDRKSRPSVQEDF